MGAEEAVQFLHWCGLDVEHQQLFRCCFLEVAQHLGMVFVPIHEPAPLELPFGSNALARQGAFVGRSELALVMLQTRAQPIKGLAGVEDEQGLGVIPVKVTEVAAAFDKRGLIAVASAPRGARDAIHVGVGGPAIDALQQQPAFSSVAVQCQGKSVGTPVHRRDAIRGEVVVKGGGAALVEADQEDAGLIGAAHASLQRSSCQSAR